MPLYVYRRADGSTFEVRQSITEDALTHDPDTGEPVTRVLFAPAVRFTGPGFYATDVGTARGNRELERAAEAGADAHDEKMRAKRRAREQAQAEGDRRAEDRRRRREAARVRGEAPAPRRREGSRGAGGRPDGAGGGGGRPDGTAGGRPGSG